MQTQTNPTEVWLGDVGTVFEATISDDAGIVDLSAATALKMIFKGPSSSPVVKTATLSNGKIKYTTAANDLDTEGWWQVQAYIEMGGGKWHSSIHRFTVHANLN